MAGIPFTLDGRAAEAQPGETIWQAAKRLGVEIPHLCHKPATPGYRPDGNCRACVVEIEGERVLAASCMRPVEPGLRVRTDSERAAGARRMVVELLSAGRTADGTALDDWRRRLGITESRFAAPARPPADASHPAIVLDHAACIHCGLCLRACREVQGNDVIGLAGRGARLRVVFDQGEPMGSSTCVACGECVQACPSGALLPSAGVAKGDRAVETICPWCGVGCRIRLHLAGQRIVGVEGADGPANRGRLCVKGRFGMDYVHHPHRLTRPLVRRDDAPPKSADLFVDPADPFTHFREADWDEALERAAAGFRRIKESHGPDALGAIGTAKGSNEEAYLLQKLARVAFGTNNVDHCARLCHSPSVAALMEGIGSGAVTAPFTDCLESDVILVVGANPPVNHPVAATFMRNAADKGAALIVIDPRANALTRHARMVLKPRPGSDVALLNAMMHAIMAEGLENRDFIAARTTGFDDFAGHLAPYAPEAMAERCGVPAEAIRAAARLYAGAKRAMIFWGMGITQHVHGTNNARCLVALALMCGQVGRAGTGLHPLRGQNNVQGVSDSGVLPGWLPGYRAVADDAVRAAFERYWGAPLNPRRGLPLTEMLHAALAGSLRGLFVMGENPALSDPDTDTVRRALATLDHLVVQDIFLTETAMFADVVLPASALPEKTGTFTNTNRQVQLAQQALMPPGDARQDWWILSELAWRLGQDWRYVDPSDAWDELRFCWTALTGITWERLRAEGAVTHPCPDESAPGEAVLMGERFSTPDGKARFVPVDIIAPDELPDAEYPLVLTTGRLLEHWHTGAMSRRSGVLDALEPAAVAHFAPAELARWGLRAGARVVVETRRGAIEVTARADASIPEGVVFVPFCFAEAPGNRLTNPALDPLARIPEYKYCAARVRPDPAGL